MPRNKFEEYQQSHKKHADIILSSWRIFLTFRPHGKEALSFFEQFFNLGLTQTVLLKQKGI